jgi:hypothetical protein
MGIRYHKAFGYGMRYPKTTSLVKKLWDTSIKGEVNALIMDAYNKVPDDYRPDKKTRVDLWQVNFDLETQAFAERKNKPYPDYFREVILNPASVDTRSQSLLFILPGRYERHVRVDDDLDYMDMMTSMKKDGSVPNNMRLKIKECPSGVYPYNSMMDNRTGQRVDDSHLACHLGQEVVPEVPMVIRVLTQYIGVNYLDLRPQIVTWWS